MGLLYPLVTHTPGIRTMRSSPRTPHGGQTKHGWLWRLHEITASVSQNDGTSCLKTETWKLSGYIKQFSQTWVKLKNKHTILYRRYLLRSGMMWVCLKKHVVRESDGKPCEYGVAFFQTKPSDIWETTKQTGTPHLDVCDPVSMHPCQEVGNNQRKLYKQFVAVHARMKNCIYVYVCIYILM